MSQNLLPCRCCGALVHTPEAIIAPYSHDTTCPCCGWNEDLEGFFIADTIHQTQHLYRKQRSWWRHATLPLEEDFAFDPGFRLIQKPDFLMSTPSSLTMEVSSDPETWFYWRNNHWHRHPQVIRKKSFVRKLKRLMQDSNRRKKELPEVSPCKRCGSPLEWYVRRSHELAFKCSVCKVLYVRGSRHFEILQSRDTVAQSRDPS